MIVTHKITGEDVTGKFFEDLKRVVEGKTPIHFPKDLEIIKMKKVMKCILLKTDGTEKVITPKKRFTLKQLQTFVGGSIDIQSLPDGREIVLNDEGKLIGLPINDLATKIWKEQYPIEKYPFNNDGLIVGDVLILENYKWSR